MPTHTLLYANTDLAKASQNNEILATLRARTPQLTAHLHDLPADAWTAMSIARAGGRSRRVRVVQDRQARLSAYPGTLLNSSSPAWAASNPRS